jgi:hypothetical protein
MMSIVFIGIGLLIGIYVFWFEQTEIFHEWANYREHLRLKQEQEERSLEIFFLD